MNEKKRSELMKVGVPEVKANFLGGLESGHITGDILGGHRGTPLFPGLVRGPTDRRLEFEEIAFAHVVVVGTTAVLSPDQAAVPWPREEEPTVAP